MTRPYRTLEQWSQIIAKFNASNMSVSSFCRIHQISTASFYQWRKQLDGLATSPDSQPMFIELTQKEERSVAEPPEWDIELELGQGVILRMRHPC